MKRGRPLVVVAAAAIVAACGADAETPMDTPLDPAASIVRVAGTACLNPIFAVGTVVGDGLVLTVAHSIAGAEEDLRVITSDLVEHPVTVVGFDPERDLALLEAETIDAAALVLGLADADDVGSIHAVTRESHPDVVPYTVRRVINARSGNIYDEGRVERSALDLVATVTPGMSGAPLIDDAGRIVGVVFASSRNADDVAYALHSSEIEAFLDSVDPATEVDRGRCR